MGRLRPVPTLGVGAEDADLSEAGEPRGWNRRGPLGLAEGAVRRDPVLEPRADPAPLPPSPFQASLHLLEAAVFTVLKAVCCDDLTLNRRRKGVIESQTFTSR